MSSSLVTDLKRYSNHSRRLQTILEETKRCFDDINESGQNEHGQFESIEMLHEEEDEVLSAATKRLGIVILGQNTYCKAEVVNKLFGRTIFPSFDTTDDKKRHRMARFRYGENLCINLELPGDYTLAENLEAYNGPWNTIPHKDLYIQDDDENTAAAAAVLEVSFNHQLLRNGCTLIVSASNSKNFEGELKQCIEGISPIIIYAFHTDLLETKEIQDLEILKEITHFQPVCFVKLPAPGGPVPIAVPGSPFGSAIVQQSSVKLPKSQQNGFPSTTLDANSNSNTNRGQQATNYQSRDFDNNCVDDTINESSGTRDVKFKNEDSNISSQNDGASQRHGRLFYSSVPPASCQGVFYQLCKIGYLSDTPGVRNISRDMIQDYFEVDSILVTVLDQFVASFTPFCEQSMQRYLVSAVTVLNNTHIRCLHTFMISAFDMAREVLITPKKLEFAREKEEELYKSLFQIAVDKGDEIREMIEKTIKDNWEKLVKKVEEYDFIGVDFGERGEILTHKGLKICTGQIQELVLGGLNQAVAGQLVNSVEFLRESYTGTLTRCLASLEMVEKENPDNHSTTDALKQILNAAYQVEITVWSSSTFIHLLRERMKQIIMTAYRLEITVEDNESYTLRRKMKQLVQALPWSQTPRIDDDWKKKIAADMLGNLSANRLAKSISSQIKDRLNKSHENFQTALRQLDLKHSGRLDKIEEDRLKLRKIYAPRVAKVALESTSLKDLIMHGMPHMGKEIGRGQYGVVYACDQWAGFNPCAVKSVVPPDDKHWNDLALEFFYTKIIPEHDRVVGLRGSVIDYSYGGGSTPAVLLIMTRMQRDLHTAIKQQLDWVSRLQVSIDVVEGIRFLHSQGLVHRDIKLKNVLLDKDNRGKITDLGFCKPEAMMSGSIVGTPIHMAPELFTGRYDNSVDVYAFGILFWYICAGNTRLPQNFEQCANKDQLWSNVKKGLRPEELPSFDKECWTLMSDCWQGEPIKRPLLGEVHQKLTKIYARFKNQPGGLIHTAKKETPPKNVPRHLRHKVKKQN